MLPHPSPLICAPRNHKCFKDGSKGGSKSNPAAFRYALADVLAPLKSTLTGFDAAKFLGVDSRNRRMWGQTQPQDHITSATLHFPPCWSRKYTKRSHLAPRGWPPFSFEKERHLVLYSGSDKQRHAPFLPFGGRQYPSLPNPRMSHCPLPIYDFDDINTAQMRS